MRGLHIAVLSEYFKEYNNCSPEEADIIFADGNLYRRALMYGKPVAVTIEPWSDEIFETIINETDITYFLKADFTEDEIWETIKICIGEQKEEEKIRFKNGKLVIDVNASDGLLSKEIIEQKEDNREFLSGLINKEQFLGPEVSIPSEEETICENIEQKKALAFEIYTIKFLGLPERINGEYKDVEKFCAEQEFFLQQKVDLIRHNAEIRNLVKNAPIEEAIELQAPVTFALTSRTYSKGFTRKDLLEIIKVEEIKRKEENELEAAGELERRKNIVTQRVRVSMLLKQRDYGVIPLDPPVLKAISYKSGEALSYEEFTNALRQRKLAEIKERMFKEHTILFKEIPMLDSSANAYKSIGVAGDNMFAVVLAMAIHNMYPEKSICISTIFMEEGIIDINLYAGDGDRADYIISNNGRVNIMTEKQENDLIIEYSSKRLVIPNYFFLRTAFQVLTKNDKILKEIVSETLKKLENEYNQ